MIMCKKELTEMCTSVTAALTSREALPSLIQTDKLYPGHGIDTVKKIIKRRIT